MNAGSLPPRLRQNASLTTIRIIASDLLFLRQKRAAEQRLHPQTGKSAADTSPQTTRCGSSVPLNVNSSSL